MNSQSQIYIQNKILTTINNIHDELFSKNKKIPRREEFNEITNYINEFLDGNEINRFLILPGIRGTGKSTLLYESYNYLVKEKKH